MLKQNISPFHIRSVEFSDMDQLLELEKEWPVDARASAETLKMRIDKFQQGFFIAEDETGIIASIICHPYHYMPGDVANFKNWEAVVRHCYHSMSSETGANALYIISGTTKPTQHVSELFNGGVNHVVELGKKLGKQYVIGGCLLPGYSRYIEKHENISASDYVFKQSQGRCVDPLIEKYRRLGFHVPDKNHVIADYFPHGPSLNYSALVVKKLGA
ncbi:hypothetical protein AQUSIP_00450 [Aquicella siphonis]|uniref:N-acetyltransferase domain-containing protein n=1 Tax=Aquicella siphonis TaxID=254247 RepID=A0A5E4PEC7_9COXI|nr:hypothetical protein [Aquicella siphonis]VVC74773.1 hypothetical protein AQUSIP_00450 [Aquicella siphonis]